jgi:hypothetical protein
LKHLLIVLGLSVWTPIVAPAVGDEPLSLQPGDQGTMLTTIQGREPEEIPVTFVGTYRNFAGPGMHLHLVELEGPRIEHVGAANGMSGSPVYFEGRLLGAVAYRVGVLPKDPIAGVRPIEDILDASRAGTAAVAPDGTAVRPIAAPVYLGGLARPLRGWIAPLLEERGFTAISGGGGAADASATGPLVPGGPVGVQLVRGDLNVATSGTVTRIDGDVVYAFGHSFLGTGRAEMPMAPAEVVHTLADWAGSTHMVNLGDPVGAVLEDRQAAIVGRLGRKARMIPLTLAIRGGDYGEQDYGFEVVAHSELMPLFTGVAYANALMLGNGYTEKATVTARGRVRLRELPELPLEMAFAGTRGVNPGLAVAGTLYALLQGLWSNPIGEVVVEGIDLTMEIRTEPVSYRVESLQYDRGRLQPGQTLDVRCVLREHRGDTLTRELSLRLPEHLPPAGQLVLAVGSPPGLNQALGNPLARRLASATDMRAVIEALAGQRSAHRLTAVVYAQGGAVVSRGTAYTELPPTVERLLSLETQAGRDPRQRPLVSPLAQAEVEMDGPIEGGKQIRLKIERGFTTEEIR